MKISNFLASVFTTSALLTLSATPKAFANPMPACSSLGYFLSIRRDVHSTQNPDNGITDVSGKNAAPNTCYATNLVKEPGTNVTYTAKGGRPSLSVTVSPSGVSAVCLFWNPNANTWSMGPFTNVNGVRCGSAAATIPDCYQANGQSVQSGKCYAYRGYQQGPGFYQTMPAPGLNSYSLFMNQTTSSGTNGNNTIRRCVNPESSNVVTSNEYSSVDSPWNQAAPDIHKRCLRKYLMTGPTGSLNSRMDPTVNQKYVSAPRQNWVPAANAVVGDQISD
jgi:hypothetical protein